MQLSFLLLSLLLLSTFHTQLHIADGQSFDFPSGKLDSTSLTPLKNGVVDSTGTLTLDSSTGDAFAFYSRPITLSSTISQTVLSFTSFFSFSSNSTSGNGTIAFVLTPDVTSPTTDSVRKTVSIEFNTSCSTGPGFVNGTFYGGHAFPGGSGWGGRGGGGGRGWRGRGPFGGMGGFQVVEYANNTVVPTQNVSGYGPNYDGSPADGPYFCSQQPPESVSPTFQYEVVVEYNASTHTLWVGSPSCGDAIARTTQFTSQDLSSIITTPVYAGFLVYGGAAFNITEWNFTNNVNTSSVSSLALSSVASLTPGSSSDGSSDSMVGGGGRRGSSGLKNGFVIAFSIIGAAIGVAAVLLVCCLCARRRRRAAATSGMYVGKSAYGGTIPESAVVFDAKKPNAPPAKVVLVEKDTMPLNTHPNSASTGAASWLQPVQPR